MPNSNAPAVSELKPCPFCGSDNIYIDDSLDRDRWQVCCNNNACPMEDIHHFANSRKDCVKAWNTRAHSPDTNTMLADIKRLREALSINLEYGVSWADVISENEELLESTKHYEDL